MSFHEGIKFPSVCLVNYFLACADRPDHTETCGFSCLPLLALTRLASVLQNGLQGGSDSIVFRLLDEAGLSVTVRQHFMIFFQGDILGNFRNQPVESQRSLCCCFGAEDSSSLSSPGCGHMSVPCREDAFFAYSPFTHPCLSLHFLSFLCFFFFLLQPLSFNMKQRSRCASVHQGKFGMGQSCCVLDTHLLVLCQLCL